MSIYFSHATLVNDDDYCRIFFRNYKTIRFVIRSIQGKIKMEGSSEPAPPSMPVLDAVSNDLQLSGGLVSDDAEVTNSSPQELDSFTRKR